MCKADREVRPIFFNKTHYLHCTTIVQDKHVKRGSQPRIKEGASHHARCGKNAEAFLIVPCQLSYEKLRRY